ncbi:DoxX family protein [Streptomyces kasugaensis]|uniref:DoxX family protein n=1 Tax=Streptomyces kasugaensis TaxID=1946 RepID=A0A4V2JI57_STRKA|nr:MULTISPECIES: DoxX family protein [Streptomyces]MYU57228.1 DoxX family membrane protein [Streptomyces sp. SID7805]TBO57311.1 DoxX family protein [Streptomyces kasugaensis]
MSVDTRTPRTPTGGRSPGFDDEPVLSSVKVPCDPAQVIVNHASFRVRLAAPVVSSIMADTARVPVIRGSAAGTRRRAPVVWSGRTDPGGAAGATTQLLHAVRDAGIGLDTGGQGEDVGTTQVLPRVRLDAAGPATVVGQRGPADSDTLPRGVRPVSGAYGGRTYGDGGRLDDDADDGRFEARDRYDGAPKRHGSDAVRHAYYPGRRMNLGVVLLPLRIFLGLISVYAGMGKLCDPVYFDGGERGSMVKWLQSLDPWTLAVPLRDFAVAHPVGAGLSVAFLQVVVGVLTICGLWQRLAASFGALLSAALLMTVSWRTIPAYDAPDIINLAAWSPLIIAGAPVYSMDARLAGEAWRRLGPRVEVADLRRRVLRRGAVLTAVVAGLTLLVGSLLGGAVRSSSVPTMPRPGEPPVNNLPGSPLPRPGESHARPGQGHTGSSAPQHRGKPSASASPTKDKPGKPSASTPGRVPSTDVTTTRGTTAHRPGATTSGTPAQRVPSRTPGVTHAPPSSGGTGGGTSGGTGGGGTGGLGGDSGRGSTLGGLLG